MAKRAAVRYADPSHALQGDRQSLREGRPGSAGKASSGRRPQAAEEARVAPPRCVVTRNLIMMSLRLDSSQSRTTFVSAHLVSCVRVAAGACLSALNNVQFSLFLVSAFIELLWTTYLYLRGVEPFHRLDGLLQSPQPLDVSYAKVHGLK